MVSLSAHGLRGSPDPSRRGFLIEMMGAGVMLGYVRSASPRRQRLARAICSSRRSGTELIRMVR